MIHFAISNYLLIANLLASGLLLGHCLFSINRMNHRTNHLVRGFYVTLAVGAAAVLLGPFYGYRWPQPAEVISNIGAAGLLWGGWMYRNRRADDVKDGP